MANPIPPVIHDPRALNMRDVYIEALEEMTKPFPSITLNAWPSWNRMTGGFRVREFSIFCGPTGSGKTTFLANLSAQLLMQGEKHFVMSVETGHTDYMKRILSVLAGKDLNTGDAVPAKLLAELHTKNQKYLESGNIEFSLYDDRVPVQQLMHDIRCMVAKGCKIAMVDNLNFFLEFTSAKEQYVEMDRVIHALIVFCKQVDVHLVMVMHPRKVDPTTGRIESELDIRGSALATQEAHNVFLFNRPKKSDVLSGLRSKFDREMFLAKMRRRGHFVGSTIVFENDNTRYTEKGFA